MKSSRYFAQGSRSRRLQCPGADEVYSLAGLGFGLSLLRYSPLFRIRDVADKVRKTITILVLVTLRGDGNHILNPEIGYISYQPIAVAKIFDSIIHINVIVVLVIIRLVKFAKSVLQVKSFE